MLQIRSRLIIIPALIIILPVLASSQWLNSRQFSERFVIGSMNKIMVAESTYAATTGAGNFGTLAELFQSGLIDGSLAYGNKYNYSFSVTVTPSSPGVPSNFAATATPRAYPRGGRRSFYADAAGDLHAADKHGDVANATDPVIDSCALFGISDNERCVILEMRGLHSAELSYASTIGSGNYAPFTELYEAALIRLSLASGYAHGYLFTLKTIDSVSGFPASFQIWAVPMSYGVSGRRSFFIDTTGTLRGADNGGVRGDENDPVIDQWQS